MKLYVKQMYDWNYYACYAEDVDEKYWNYFKTELWWQLGNGFIKTYYNVEWFEYCAKIFMEFGEDSVNQSLKIAKAPWQEALQWLIIEMKKTGAPWYLHGSTAMALWGIDVEPRDINIIVANYSDYDRVREHFYQYAIKPFQRCGNWVMSGLGTVFHQANIGFSFNNKELEPYDMSTLRKTEYKGEVLYISTLEMLKRDNESYGRPERVEQIEEKIKRC